MKGRNALKMVVVLAVISAAGIIGMLLTRDIADTLLLVLAALPLAVGAWCWRAEARRQRHPANTRQPDPSGPR